MPPLWSSAHLIFLALVTVVMVLLTVSELIEEKMQRHATANGKDAGRAAHRQSAED